MRISNFLDKRWTKSMKTNSPKRPRISVLTLTLGHMWNVKNPKLGRGSHPSLLKQYLTYYNTMNLNTVKLRMVKFGGFYLDLCIADHNLRVMFLTDFLKEQNKMHVDPE